VECFAEQMQRQTSSATVIEQRRRALAENGADCRVPQQHATAKEEELGIARGLTMARRLARRRSKSKRKRRRRLARRPEKAPGKRPERCAMLWWLPGVGEEMEEGREKVARR
jgi:hypothetical protein